MRTIQAIMVSLFVSLVVPAQAASFDCRKARTHVEKTICADPTLSQLDSDMAVQYRQSRQQASDTSSLISEQKRWLTYQRNTCQSTSCLTREYQEKLAAAPDYVAKPLTKLTKVPVTPASERIPRTAYGTYQLKKTISIYDSTAPSGYTQGATTDMVKVSAVKQQPSNATVTIHTTAHNAHLCTLESHEDGSPIVFHWRENHLVYREKVTDDQQCELRLYPRKRAVLIRDMDNNCRTMYCGVRAGFDGLILRKK